MHNMKQAATPVENFLYQQAVLNVIKHAVVQPDADANASTPASTPHSLAQDKPGGPVLQSATWCQIQGFTDTEASARNASSAGDVAAANVLPPRPWYSGGLTESDHQCTTDVVASMLSMPSAEDVCPAATVDVLTSEPDQVLVSMLAGCAAERQFSPISIPKSLAPHQQIDRPGSCLSSEDTDDVASEATDGIVDVADFHGTDEGPQAADAWFHDVWGGS